MLNNSPLIERLADDRRLQTRRLAAAQHRPARPSQRTGRVRVRTGWFLVALGLRLATAGSDNAGRATTVAGR
jgi:hypothetical protein